MQMLSSKKIPPGSNHIKNIVYSKETYISHKFLDGVLPNTSIYMIQSMLYNIKILKTNFVGRNFHKIHFIALFPGFLKRLTKK